MATVNRVIVTTDGQRDEQRFTFDEFAARIGDPHEARNLVLRARRHSMNRYATSSDDRILIGDIHVVHVVNPVVAMRQIEESEVLK